MADTDVAAGSQIAVERLRLYDTSPASFRNDLVIDRVLGESGGFVDVVFGAVMDDWQRFDFEELDPAWLALAGKEELRPGACRRAYFERPRGHSKTMDQAVMALWALIFARQPLRGICCAADKEQAKLLRHAMERLVHLNPWMSDFLDMSQIKVSNPRTGAMLKIIATDAMGSYGETPDFVMADELTHWGNEAFWVAIASAIAKRPRSVMVIISNAGTGKGSSWQWKLRENVRASDGWYFSRLDGPIASWMAAEDLEEQRRLLPPQAYARLWLNSWTAGKGDAISEEDIQRAIHVDLEETVRPEPGWTYAAGLDLSLSIDTTALVIVGRRDNRYRLAKIRAWTPSHGQRINIAEVESAVMEEYRIFRWRKAYVDPWQSDLLRTRLTNRRVPIFSWWFHPKSWDTLARNLFQQMLEDRIEIYPHGHLIEELRAACVIERASSLIRLEWARDEQGHGDRATAFLLALMAAKESPELGAVSRPSMQSRSDSLRSVARTRALAQRQSVSTGSHSSTGSLIARARALLN